MKAIRTMLAVLLLLSQSSCALHPRVEALGPGGYAALNQRTARVPARLLLRDGTRVDARGLVLGDGRASWTDAATGAPAGAAVTEVAEVRVKNETGRGTAIGGTWGFLIGAPIGALLGLGSGDDGSDGPPMNTGALALAGAVVFGTLGWIIGLPIGAVRGVDDVYLLPPPPPGTPDRLLEGGVSRP